MLFKSCHLVIMFFFFSCCEIRDEKEELIPEDLNTDNGNSSAQSSTCKMNFPILQKSQAVEKFFILYQEPKILQASSCYKQLMQLYLRTVYIPQEVRNSFKFLLSVGPDCLISYTLSIKKPSPYNSHFQFHQKFGI